MAIRASPARQGRAIRLLLRFTGFALGQKRENPDTGLGSVDCHKSTAQDFVFAEVQRADNVVSDRRGHSVLGANLEDAGSSCPGRRKQCPEIHVVREENASVFASPCQDFFVRRSGIPQLTPMNALEARPLQKRNPLWREIHVEHDSHGSGTSVSCVRHAA